MLLIGNNTDAIKEVNYQVSSKFDMKDIGAANFILEMEKRRDCAKNIIILNQRKYVEIILRYNKFEF